MEGVMTYAQVFFGWLLQMTLIASLVICLILLIQKILGSRLGPRWSHALWLVLLIRMILPWAPSSRLSLSNLIPSLEQQIQNRQQIEPIEQKKISAVEQTTVTSEAIPSQEVESEAAIQTPVVPKPPVAAEMKDESKPRLVSLRRVLPILWLAGALIIGIYLLISNFALWRIIKRDRPLVNQSMLELFEECKTQMGVQSLVVVVPSDKVRSPGLFGFVRPRLLLPREMLDTATREEMRYVFLHELAHLKRHDIYLGWLTSLLQVLHWFNPLIWFAFYRMRADRELACDALVLTRTGQDKSQEYGSAILGLVRRFYRSRPLPAMAGIMEDKSQLKRRIAMITQFKNSSYRWSPLAVILIIILASVSLPDAISMQTSEISSKESAPPISLRRVWAGSDVDIEGEISPDGRYISYVDWDTGDLAVYEVATGKKQRLTNKGTWDESDEFAEFSRWSPDSKKIVYDWYNKEYFIELRIVGLDGSEPRILYRNKEVTWTRIYDWSPDGKNILAVFGNKDGDRVVLVSVEDGSVRALKTLKRYHPHNMVFSPDGRYIVYDFPQNDDSPERDIFLLSADGNREIPLVEHPADDRFLDWTPDGKNILFTSDRTGSPCMWSIAMADGIVQGVPRLVKPNTGLKLISMGFTKDGSFYYGCGGRGISDVYTAKLDLQTGKVLSPPKKAVLHFEGHNGTGNYSPDGKYLAYVSHRGIRRQILCIRSLETGQEREFPLKLKRILSPRWSPDGNSILIAGMDFNSERFGIYQVDPKTGIFTPVMLPSKGFRFNSHEWSRDGNSFFQGRNSVKDKYSQIMLREIKSGKEKEIYRTSDLEQFRLACSPDGKWLAFINMRNDGTEGALKVLPSVGGESRELYKCEPKKEGLWALEWTPDGKYILFIKREIEQKQFNLWRIPVGGGEPQKIDLGINITGLSIHPDGQHIAFGARENQPAEVWVMKNFLPEAPVAESAHRPTVKKIWIPTQPGSGVLSPDGEKLAFVSEGSVWVVPVHGKVSPDIAGEPMRLTEPIGAWDVASTLAWSADGKWIAFNVSGEKEYDAIYVIRSSGGTPRKVPVQPRRRSVLSYRLSLSPDGRVVAFCSRYIEESEVEPPISLRGSFLYTVPVAGGKVKRLTDTWSGEQTFSPDGKKIAFVKYDTFKKGELCVIPSVGGNPIQISDSDPNRIVRGPVWSPDGKMIAFISQTASERNEVCIIPVSATDEVSANPTKIQLPLDSYDVLAGWTRDNKIGVFLHNPDPWAIHTVPASGGQAVQVTPTGWATHPQWSPEGQRIYFRWNGGAIASVPSDGGELSIVRIHRDPPVGLCYPGSGNAVSPDGKQIVFSDGINIYTVPVEGGESKEVTQGRYPCWSPDGRSIAFIRTYQRPVKSESGWNIYIIPSKGGEVRQLTFESDNIRRTHIDWSPDGKSIAYFGKDKTIRIIPVQGGESRIVATAEELRNHDELAWSPDGSKLVYSSKGSLWMVPSDGGEPMKVRSGLNADAGHVSWSPDGKKLAFTAIKGGGEDLYLIENFRPEQTGK